MRLETCGSSPHRVDCETRQRLSSLARLLRGRKARTGMMLLGGLGLGVGIAMAASVVVVDTNNVRLRVVQSAFEEGFDSGWHTHPGPVIVQVQEGMFKIYQGGCVPKIVHEGETLVEVPLVPVRAIAKGPIKWTTSQILPMTEPPQTPAPVPCD